MPLLERLARIARDHGFKAEMQPGYVKLWIPYTRRKQCGCIESGAITETIRNIPELRNALGY